MFYTRNVGADGFVISPRNFVLFLLCSMFTYYANYAVCAAYNWFNNMDFSFSGYSISVFLAAPNKYILYLHLNTCCFAVCAKIGPSAYCTKVYHCSSIRRLLQTFPILYQSVCFRKYFSALCAQHAKIEWLK